MLASGTVGCRYFPFFQRNKDDFDYGVFNAN
jgi:hypothetical protein